jgi:hypothetical protein
MFPVADASTLFEEFHALPALVMPYFTTSGAVATFARDGKTHPFCRVRYLEEPPKAGGFTKAKPLRYGQPIASGVRAYFPQVKAVDWAAIAASPKAPILVTEGEKKALATTLAGFATVGLGGVYNFLSEGELIPELAAFKWHGREVYIVFDSDARLNPNIQAAEARLVDMLGRDRGAKIYLVRLPPDGDDKVGLDDFLVSQGADRLEKLLRGTEALGVVDAAIVALNRHVAWIERDGSVYDIAARHFLKTDAFVRGSRYSAETVRRVVTTGKKPGIKEVPVAATWLTHPLARRHADLLFRPGEGALVTNEVGAPSLNVWHGWNAAEGDVTPFLELTAFLMSRLPAEHRDFPLKWLAYKAQNPQLKIPLGMVLLGRQGCGKTLWSECVQRAFAPYSKNLPSSALRAPFQGWLERNLVIVINEVEPDDMEEGKERLKTLISETTQNMNEKYRVAREVNSYVSFILTANDHAAGAFSGDDRRMFVVGCPSPREIDFYTKVGDWKNGAGPAALMHWLLHVDLKGWRPPPRPPMTAEKWMAHMESLSQVEQLAEDTLTANENTVKMWIDASMAWANAAVASGNAGLARHAQEIIDSYNTIQIRDWYTPDELSRMFPQIAAALYGSRRTLKTPAGEISRELRNSGLAYLECADDPRGFMWRGKLQQFIVIANRDDWRLPLKQSEFDRRIKEWPRYVDLQKSNRRVAKSDTA